MKNKPWWVVRTEYYSTNAPNKLTKAVMSRPAIVPKYFFDNFQRWNDGLQRGIKISVVAFWQGEIFDLKVVKYLDESKSLKTQSYICLCWLTSRQSISLILVADNSQSNWLNTIAVRASYILPIFEAISLVKTEKNRGGGGKVSLK